MRPKTNENSKLPKNKRHIESKSNFLINFPTFDNTHSKALAAIQQKIGTK